MTYLAFLSGQELTVDRLNERLVEELMEWTPLSSIGTYATNFSAAANTPRMRKIRILDVEVWQYAGRITVTTLTANVDTLAFTFNAGHRPVFEHGWQLTGASTAFYGVRTTLQTNGQLRVGVPTAAGGSTNGIMLDGLYIDDPLTA